MSVLRNEMWKSEINKKKKRRIKILWKEREKEKIN